MNFPSGLHPQSKFLAIIACLITQGGYSQEKREHTEAPGPSSLESLGSGAEWTTPFPGFSWTEHPKAFSEVGEPVEYEIQIATDADFETLVDEDRVALSVEWKPANAADSAYHTFYKGTIRGKEWMPVHVRIDTEANQVLLRFRFDCGPADNAAYDTVQIADIEVFTEGD